MRTGMFKLVVAFFKRPVKLSDAAAILYLFKKKKTPVENPDSGATDKVVARRSLSGEPIGVRNSAHDTWRETSSVAALDVSEQPLDTLPAELQNELRPNPKP